MTDAENTSREFVLRRLAEPWQFFGQDAAGTLWLAIVIPLLLLGLAYVVVMYRRDSRSIPGPIAFALGCLRALVYLILAGVFLLPAWQSWEIVQKRSRAVLLIDCSPSMTEKSDDLPPDDGRTVELPRRIDKVIEFLTDSESAFLKRLLEKNPVYVYRFGARLDDEPAVLEKGQPEWDAGRWKQWLTFDPRRWVLDQVDAETQAALARHPAFVEGAADWAAAWTRRRAEEVIPTELDEPRREKLLAVRARLDKRAEAVRQIRLGTDVGDSVLQALARESGNMPQGLIVVSDGRSTLGVEASLAEARTRAAKDRVPIFAVLAGEDRPVVEIRITDVQTPEQTPPNEKFVLRVEIDGVGLPDVETDVFLDAFAPGARTPTHTFRTKAKFQAGAPPHAQAEFALDPDVRDGLPAEMFRADAKEFVEGEWKFVARAPRDKREAFSGKEHVAPAVSVQVIKKPLRVLLVAGGPTHDYQFLRTMLVRESDQKRAELSVFLQNEGRDGRAVQDVPPERLLNRFPSLLTTEDDPNEKPEDRFYNLARYDTIVMYDPDWSEFTAEQLELLKKWVDTQAGGLVLIAGPVNTFQLARGEEDGRLKPLLDLFPVVPGDSVLVAGPGRKNPRTPWRLNFAGASPDMDFLKLDDDSKDPLGGWKQFFDGEGPPGPQPVRGFYAGYPVKAVKPGAAVVATITDPSARMPDGKEHPFLVTMPYGKGRVAFIGSAEFRRLRQYREVFYERFWLKLARWTAAGGRTRQNRRGVLVMGREFAAGGYIRVEAQLFGPTLEPLPRNTRAKLAFAGPDGSDRKEVELTAKPATSDWAGWFQARFPAPRPGEYSLSLPIPGSGDVLRGKFIVRATDPELDNARPDPAALAALAGDVREIDDRVPEAGDRAAVRARVRGGVSGGEAASARLLFPLAGADIIPIALTAQTKEQRNRGAVDDIWDDGPTLGRTPSGRPIEISAVLLVVAGLLSVEWLGRKLLRLA